MPLFMDRHYVEGATKHTLKDAHELDLAVQDRFNIKFITYWFDELRSTAFCLAESPDKETIQKAHNEAHGGIPHEIIEVDPGIVEAFLGRVKDPTPVVGTSSGNVEAQIDAAFRVIMFTDLKDSTLMATKFGDNKALHLLRIHNALTRTALREFGGAEVKHTGDGIMASFASVPDAVECAISIQESFAAHNESHPEAHPEETLHVRIGLSAGEPIEEDGDLYGKAVNMAARLCAHAETGQVLVAQVVKDNCQSDSLCFAAAKEINPKGFEQNMPVFEARRVVA
jgi:class 3 adenylate cyclase